VESSSAAVGGRTHIRVCKDKKRKEAPGFSQSGGLDPKGSGGASLEPGKDTSGGLPWILLLTYFLETPIEGGKSTLSFPQPNCARLLLGITVRKRRSGVRGLSPVSQRKTNFMT
jgi:hypothetical protein